MSDIQAKRLGELLIEQGLINAAMLEESLSFLTNENRPLGKILLELGYVTNEDLNSVLAKQFGSLYLNPKTFQMRNTEILTVIPKEIARQYVCFPYDKLNDELTMVMDDPFNTEAISELSKITNMVIRPVYAKRSAILEVLDKLYGPSEIPTLNAVDEPMTAMLTPEYNIEPAPQLEDSLSSIFSDLNLDDNPISHEIDFSSFSSLPLSNQLVDDISTDSSLVSEPIDGDQDLLDNIPEPSPDSKDQDDAEPALSEELTETKRPWATVMPKQPATDLQDGTTSKKDQKLPMQYLTFENFVVAPSNQLAWAAAQNVVSQPGIGFNPLFIYGGVGLGKTHLGNAIGNALMRRYPKAKVCYITIDTFVRELIDAVEHGNLKTFRARYRNLDTLIIDDVQFLSGQEQTQEEFFYVFEQLYRTNGQMVITSDRLPRQIDKLEDRLRSRFEGGLTVDIQPPDLETRIAIFRKKVIARGLEVDDEIARLVASRLPSNIRELEGLANRLFAQSQLMHEPISFEMVKQILDTMAPSEFVKKEPEIPLVTRPGSLPSEGFR